MQYTFVESARYTHPMWTMMQFQFILSIIPIVGNWVCHSNEAILYNCVALYHIIVLLTYGLVNVQWHLRLYLFEFVKVPSVNQYMYSNIHAFQALITNIYLFTRQAGWQRGM